jgi:diaminohydroxyphosphoribosylaminopyrimidine deaminase/5-amino-6-(5-phosphoribosylamino)uracil reductase
MNHQQLSNINYLQQALSLASIRRGFCAPNPAVGALVVKNGHIIAMGYHWASGYAHAEVDALNKLGDESKGATLYVTLEPCCHYGKTPPCTQLLIDRGISTVYYAFKDPNPIVAGKGQQQLQAAGITCIHLPLPEIDEFYKSYIHWTHHALPWVTAKLAISLDGKIAAAQGKQLAITGPELQHYTHQQRKKSDAILTTANTIIKDNPQLNVRLDNEIISKPIYVLDSHLRLPLTAAITKTASKLTIFHHENAAFSQRQRWQELGVHCMQVPCKDNNLSLVSVLNTIGQDGIHDLWIEAGGVLFTAFHREKLVQRSLLYIAPKCLGAHAIPAFRHEFDFTDAKQLYWQSYGNDVLCCMEW